MLTNWSLREKNILFPRRQNAIVVLISCLFCSLYCHRAEAFEPTANDNCYTLADTTEKGISVGNGITFPDDNCCSTPNSYYYVYANVTTQTSSSWAAYSDMYLIGADDHCGGWFGGLYYGKPFIGTQCNMNSDDIKYSNNNF